MKKYIVLLLFICISNLSNAQYKYSDFSIIKPPHQFYDTLEMLKTMPESNTKAMLESRAFTFYFYSNYLFLLRYNNSDIIWIMLSLHPLIYRLY